MSLCRWLGCHFQHPQHAMVVAMIAMGMVKVAVDQVINVVAMRHGGMAAVGPMNMVLRMAAKLLLGGAPVGMLRVHLNHMLVNAVTFLMFQMAAFQVIGMALVPDSGMAAAGAVLVF